LQPETNITRLNAPLTMTCAMWAAARGLISRTIASIRYIGRLKIVIITYKIKIIMVLIQVPLFY